MACDYAGIKGFYVDKRTGKKVNLHMFVAVLAHSNLLFAYFTPDLTAKSWCRAIVKALHFFGGVPAVIQFDNASLVNRSGLIEEFNEQFVVLSRYYRTVGLAIRPCTPRDNAPAEKSVQFIQARVLVPMKRECFYSLEDAQSHLLNEVEVLNGQPMQKLKVSRRTLFEQREMQALSPITRSEYQPFDERCQRTSTSNGTVNYNNHEYSVPYEMRNKKLTLQVTGTNLTVLDDFKEIASHALSNGHSAATIKKEHNHPNQNYEDSKNEFEFLRWAESLDDSVVEVVKSQYLGMKSSQSRRAGNNCLVLQKLCKSAGEESLIAACQYAVTHELTRITQIMGILDSELYLDTQDDYEDEIPAFLTQAHKNIRGVDQIRGARHV
jgi:hypothetical protein